MTRRRRVEPGPGQESVWDYPRPPRLEPSSRRIRILLGGETIVDATRSARVLETSHPPVHYIPPEEFVDGSLSPADGSSMCEWKGRAVYFDVSGGTRRAQRAAWAYPRPNRRFSEIAGWVAVYPSLMDACFLDDVQVQAQEGDFYGGWITPEIVGPFKGGRGTWGW
jgi:uncharacterized protein (DUF427 family)